MNNPWIDCKVELPPCDEKYEVGFYKIGWPLLKIEEAYYNGYGFYNMDNGGAMEFPKCWRYIRKKIYGKIIPESSSFSEWTHQGKIPC